MSDRRVTFVVDQGKQVGDGVSQLLAQLRQANIQSTNYTAKPALQQQPVKGETDKGGGELSLVTDVDPQSLMPGGAQPTDVGAAAASAVVLLPSASELDTSYPVVVGVDLGSSNFRFAYTFSGSVRRHSGQGASAAAADAADASASTNDAVSTTATPAAAHSEARIDIATSQRNCLLLDADSLQLIGCGDQAVKQFGERTATVAQRVLYFENYKQQLCGPIAGKTKIRATNGTAVDAEVVLSHVLSHIKNTVAARLGVEYNINSDVKWVLTVPAIWTPKAKQLLTDAAVNAGMRQNPLQLVLANEPESASIFIRSRQMHMGCSDSSTMQQPNHSDQNNYSTVAAQSSAAVTVVVDAGSGTVDVQVHRDNIISNSREKSASLSAVEVAVASGGVWGSSLVNDQFNAFLGELIGIDVLQQFQESEHQKYCMMMHAFDVIKHSLNTSDCGGSIIELNALNEFLLHNALLLSDCVNQFNENNSRNSSRSRNSVGSQINNGSSGYSHSHSHSICSNNTFSSTPLTLDGTRLSIPASRCLSFLQPVLDTIIEHVSRVIIASGATQLLLVGGFAHAEPLQKAMRAVCQQQHVNYYSPLHPETAVVAGAVNFGLAPRSITSRKMPFTVGVDNRSSSNSSGMKILVLQGDDIPLDFILPQYCFPASDHSEKVVITLFHSHSRILDATTAKRLVAIEVPVVPVCGMRASEQEIQLSVKFGGAMLEMWANNGQPVNISYSGSEPNPYTNHFIFVIDKSYSMREPMGSDAAVSRIDTANQAVCDFLQARLQQHHMNAVDTVTLITFNGEAELHGNMIRCPLTPALIAALQQQPLQADGFTNFCGAWDLVNQVLLPKSKYPHELGVCCVFLTDGEDNADAMPAEQLRAMCNDYKPDQLECHVIRIGPETEKSVKALSVMSNLMRAGAVRRPQDAEGLIGAFQSLACTARFR